ncbi:hypothetical protein CFB89_18940 [Burkholderia sp. AU16741]|nr:hypothetical protein CFB89_18940 [Burkholderia sp. AU16741]
MPLIQRHLVIRQHSGEINLVKLITRASAKWMIPPRLDTIRQLYRTHLLILRNFEANSGKFPSQEEIPSTLQFHQLNLYPIQFYFLPVMTLT